MDSTPNTTKTLAIRIGWESSSHRSICDSVDEITISLTDGTKKTISGRDLNCFACELMVAVPAPLASDSSLKDSAKAAEDEEHAIHQQICEDGLDNDHCTRPKTCQCPCRECKNISEEIPPNRGRDRSPSPTKRSTKPPKDTKRRHREAKKANNAILKSRVVEFQDNVTVDDLTEVAAEIGYSGAEILASQKSYVAIHVSKNSLS